MAGMDAKAARHRWFSPTPAWLVYGAAVATGLLYACERWRWFPNHYQKGWPVLLAVAVMGAVLILTLAWMLVSLIFRRRVQFGLRTLLVFVTLCAVVCSWLAVRLREARRQAEVIAALNKKFYYIELDSEFDNGGNRLADPIAPGTQPLRDLLGSDFFTDVEGLTFLNTELTDEDLADVASLTRLKRLSLVFVTVTDAGLSHLEGLTNLRSLFLITNVSDDDDGVKKLKRALPKCEIESDEVHITK
jgi:hypothetical protein